jgi:hypothetical protein
VRDLLDVEDPAVRRRERPARVWVDLDAVLGGRGNRGEWNVSGVTVQPSPGWLLGWVRTVGHGWAAVVEVAVAVAGGEAAVRMMVPRAAITPDSLAYRRKLGGKTSNRPTLADGQ